MPPIENQQELSLMNELPFGIIQVDMAGKAVFINDFALDILQKERAEIIGVHFNRFNWPQLDGQGDILPIQDYSLHKALEEGQVIRDQLQCAIINGLHRYLSVSAQPVQDESGLKGALCTFLDVTEKVENEQLYRKESGRYRILLENLDAVVWESEYGTKTFTYISPQVVQMLGFTKEKWLKDGFWQSRIFEEDRDWLLTYEASVLNDAKKYQLEYRLVHEDGSIVWIEDMVEVVFENGSPVRTRGLMVDITARKRAEIDLAESEQRYRHMIDEAPYGISIYDRKGTLIATNASNEEMWGFKRKDYIGTFNLHEDDLFQDSNYRRRIQESFDGIPGEVVSEMPLPDGSRKWFRIKYYPLFDGVGRLDHVVYISEDISKYVLSEHTLREERELKQDILDALDEAIIVVNKDARVIDINHQLRKYIRGKKYGKLTIGSSLLKLIDLFPEREFLRNGLRSVLEEEAKILEHEMKLPDGKWYNLRVTPLQTSPGAVISWQNINTRKEIEMALEKSLEKYRNLYNRAPVMMHSIGSDKRIINVSDFWLEKMGYDRNEVIGRYPWDFLTRDSKQDAKADINKMIERGAVRNVSYRFRRKDEEKIDVVLSAIVEYDENQKMERAIAGMLDVTELRKAEQKLQESQTKLLEAQSISKIASYEYDVVSDTLFPSSGMVAMYGLKPRHCSMAGGIELIHPDDLIHFQRTFAQAVRDGSDFSCTYRIILPDTGQMKWVAGRGRMLKNDAGEVVRMVGTVQEITDQKVTEDRIKRLTDRVLLATEIASIGVWEYDKNRDEIYWGDQMYTIFSDCKQPIKGTKQLRQVIIEEDRMIVEEGLHFVNEGINFFELEFRIRAGNGIKYVRAFTRINRDERGKFSGLIGVVYDVTADKTLQQKLESSLQEKDVLMKEVHHRVKNNLQLMSSILALKSYDLHDENAKKVFEEVNGRIKAMSVIHDKLYAFYNLSEIDIREYLTHIASELQILQANEFLKIQSFSEYAILDVEKALLIGLTVSELVVNAAKHSFEKNQKGAINIHFSTSGEENILRVLNDGLKVPEDVLDRKSRGLGISLIKTFVNQLGGRISIDPDNGFRATF